MRRWLLMVSTGLMVAGLGCSRTLQHTSGVCDCDPPPVESVLHPYASPAAPPPAPIYPSAAPASNSNSSTTPALPKVVEPPK
jgi:hypothetical protein